MSRAESGRAAEDAAAALLAAKGLKVVARTFRAKVGELDLVARDGGEIVFVEVRSRGSAGFGGAAASIQAPKRRRLVRAAQLWIQARGWTGPCRFDVVAIDEGRAEHIPAAFDATGLV